MDIADMKLLLWRLSVYTQSTRIWRNIHRGNDALTHPQSPTRTEAFPPTQLTHIDPPVYPYTYDSNDQPVRMKNVLTNSPTHRHTVYSSNGILTKTYTYKGIGPTIQSYTYVLIDPLTHIRTGTDTFDSTGRVWVGQYYHMCMEGWQG